MSETVETPVVDSVTRAVMNDDFTAFKKAANKAADKFAETKEIPVEKSAKEAPEPTAAEKSPAQEVEQVTESGAETPSEPKKPSKMGYGELRAKLKEQEAEILRLKEAPKAEAKVEPKVEVKAEKLRTKPTPKDTNEDGTPKYKDYEEYIEDLADWKAESRFTEFRKEEAKRQQEAQIQAKNQEIQKSWDERVTKAQEKHDDFGDVLDPKTGPGADIQAGSVVDQWILDSEFGAEILYHFGKNRSELKKINALHPIAAARELTKLESKLSGETVTAPKTETLIRTTKAPPPAREVGGRGTIVTDEVTKAVADDDFVAFRNAANRKEIAARR